MDVRRSLSRNNRKTPPCPTVCCAPIGLVRANLAPNPSKQAIWPWMRQFVALRRPLGGRMRRARERASEYTQADGEDGPKFWLAVAGTAKELLVQDGDGSL